MAEYSSADSARVDAPALHGLLPPLIAAACMLGGVLVALKPSLFAGRFVPQYAAALVVGRSIGASLAVLGLGIGLWPRVTGARARLVLQCGIAVGAYLPLTLIFRDWHVDDAAITYAYSDNLARGLGLVLNAGRLPEEAYSNTIWMLMLAACRWLGADVAAASKVLSTLIGCGVLVLVLVTLRDVLGRPLSGPGFAVTLAGCLSQPFLIWSISGLEHGLQALLLVTLVWAATRPEHLVWICSATGCALVLVRPEEPLVIAMLCVGVALYRSRTEWDFRKMLQLWPMAWLPALTLFALLGFRHWYFHDLLPNPYYAKAAASATFLRALNPYGAGWNYVVDWLARGGGFILLVPFAFYRWRDLPLAIVIATWVLAGQLAFVLYAGGDWMMQWRFLAAPLALLSLMAGYGVERFLPEIGRLPSRYALVAVTALWLCNVPLLVQARHHPSTPYLVVSEIGNTFVDLAKRLGIAKPLLAHHDAGGISYRAHLDLLDLGGLGSREVAKHFQDGAFLREYVFAQRKPDFIFGAATNFAAGTMKLAEDPRFARDYVRLKFPAKPVMANDLCHIRRDRIRPAAGITIEHDRDGAEIVVVDGPR